MLNTLWSNGLVTVYSGDGVLCLVKMQVDVEEHESAPGSYYVLLVPRYCCRQLSNVDYSTTKRVPSV